MRSTLRAGCLLAATTTVASGCGVDCGPASDIAGVYDVFANVVEYDGTNLENYPADTSPATGWSEWSILVDADSVTVLIDEASFPARAAVSTIECGRFTLGFDGPYRQDGDLHALSVAGEFSVFADHLEGTWDYEEEWTSGTASGTFEATGNVSGTRTGEPFSE
jgi:hypothetical protein